MEAVGPDAVDVLDSPRKLGRKEIVSEWICVTKTTSRRTDYSRVTRQLLNEWANSSRICRRVAVESALRMRRLERKRPRLPAQASAAGLQASRLGCSPPLYNSQSLNSAPPQENLEISASPGPRPYRKTSIVGKIVKFLSL